MNRLKYCGPAIIGVLALSVLAAGCGGSRDITTPAVTPPTPITEPLFTGTLTVNGGVTQPFLSTSSGTTNLTVNALADSNGPSPIGVAGTIRVGMALGTWNGTVCQAVLTNDNSFVATVITGVITGSGALCARIYDVGKLTEPVTFEIKIEHP